LRLSSGLQWASPRNYSPRRCWNSVAATVPHPHEPGHYLALASSASRRRKPWFRPRPLLHPHWRGPPQLRSPAPPWALPMRGKRSDSEKERKRKQLDPGAFVSPLPTAEVYFAHALSSIS